MIRRISIFGGPGISKTTSAAYIFSILKQKHFNVEHVTEAVKPWVYSGRKIEEYDQIYLFGKQMQMEYQFLSKGVDCIVTDSPVLLASVYSELYYSDRNFSPHLEAIYKDYDQNYPSLNIILKRDSTKHPYKQTGRYQTEAEAINIDNKIEDKVRQCCDPSTIVEIAVNDWDLLVSTVITRLTPDK